MKARWAAAVLLGMLGTAVAQQGGHAPTLEQRAAAAESRAAASHGGECVHASYQAANLRLDDASQLYEDNKPARAREAVRAAVADAERITDCSLKAPRTQKTAEIDLRLLLRRLAALTNSLELDEHPYLKARQAEIDKQHDRVLHELFGDASGPSEKKKP